MERVDRLLLQCYGDRPWSPRFPHLLDGLVHTLLSQNTSDNNSHLAFRRLKERFPSWDEAARAPVEEVEEAIRPGGISRVKAERIKTLLELVRRDFGSYCLAPLAEREPGEALHYLLGLPGVGRKTAAVLLLFQLGHPYFPVDTHVFRVGRRLGIIPDRSGFEQAHEFMDRLVPDEMKYRLHLNLIQHGRRVCRAGNPRCGECCLRKLCPYPERRGGRVG
ncbi:MAG: endonuclease III [Actinomycetota bacterium]|nr:endonuclease III [Actinomycetota bacterium]MDI7252859.1 endonuclease III [Actinomycetota bacterium]